MVTVRQLSPVGRVPQLGEQICFAPSREVEAVEYYLEHDGVFYPEPLKADADRSVRLFPEAPGRYTLYAAWQTANSQRGWAHVEFVISGLSSSLPQEVRFEASTFWVPTAWDRAILGAHEIVMVRELKRMVRPGMTVYDVGANIGTYSSHFASWIGPAGRLYAIEPNPLCVSYLRANLERTTARNYSVLPLALSNGPCTVRFTINYASSMIGIGSDSPQTGKPGHTIQVQGESLDRLVTRLNLRNPDFIKVDVEGAEGSVIAGMLDTLVRSRPILMLELHGREPAKSALHHLRALEYRFRTPGTATTYETADSLLATMPEACVQVIGSPADRRESAIG
jgi:FkbM family methyltransferase